MAEILFYVTHFIIHSLKKNKAGEASGGRHGFIATEDYDQEAAAFLWTQTSALRTYHRGAWPVRFRGLHSGSGRDDPFALQPQGCFRRRSHWFWKNPSFPPCPSRDYPRHRFIQSNLHQIKSRLCLRFKFVLFGWMIERELLYSLIYSLISCIHTMSLWLVYNYIFHINLSYVTFTSNLLAKANNSKHWP